jgi:hypothetical protein
MAKTLESHRENNNSMFPHPRPLPRDEVACVGHSGSRGRGETRSQRRTRSHLTVETTTRAPHAPTRTHSSPTAIAPGTGTFSRLPPQSPPQRFQPTSAQGREKMCLSPSGPPQTLIGNPSAPTLGCATTDRSSANCPRCARLPQPNSSGRAQPAPTDAFPAGDRAPSDWGLSPPDPHRVQRSEFQRSISRTPRDLRLPSPTHTKTDDVARALGWAG